MGKVFEKKGKQKGENLEKVVCICPLLKVSTNYLFLSHSEATTIYEIQRIRLFLINGRENVKKSFEIFCAEGLT